MQDSFIKIWKNIASYDANKGTLFTWLLNVARHTAIDRLRTATMFKEPKRLVSAVKQHQNQ